MHKLIVLGIFVAFFAACGGAAAPHERVASATAAVRAAEVGGAPAVPQAALQLQRAKQELELAKAMIAEDDNEKAALKLEQAEVDAELALALAKEQKAKAEAKQAAEQVETLKKKRIE